MRPVAPFVYDYMDAPAGEDQLLSDNGGCPRCVLIHPYNSSNICLGLARSLPEFIRNKVIDNIFNELGISGRQGPWPCNREKVHLIIQDTIADAIHPNLIRPHRFYSPVTEDFNAKVWLTMKVYDENARAPGNLRSWCEQCIIHGDTQGNRLLSPNNLGIGTLCPPRAWRLALIYTKNEKGTVGVASINLLVPTNEKLHAISRAVENYETTLLNILTGFVPDSLWTKILQLLGYNQ
jgi:hypothetical protein